MRRLTVVSISLMFGLSISGCLGMGSRFHAKDMFDDPAVAELAEAGRRGDVKKIDKMVKSGVNVNTRGKEGATPLIWSMMDGRKEGYKRLLELGADPNVRTERDASVMNLAAKAKDTFFLEEALKHGGDPNFDLMNDGCTLIFDSVLRGTKEHIAMLIKAGANINAQDRFTLRTPLMSATDLSKYNIVMMLLEAGADYKIVSAAGKTIVYSINETRNLNPGSEQYDSMVKVVEFLKAKGVEVELPEQKPSTATITVYKEDPKTFIQKLDAGETVKPEGVRIEK